LIYIISASIRADDNKLDLDDPKSIFANLLLPSLQSASFQSSMAIKAIKGDKCVNESSSDAAIKEYNEAKAALKKCFETKVNGSAIPTGNFDTGFNE
jgi:hypothetical protein